MKGKFSIVLIFEKEENRLVTSFVDRNDTEQKIIADHRFKFIVPGLRYYCLIQVGTWDILKASIYNDDLMVDTDIDNNIIKLLNNDDEVIENRFDPSIDGNYDKATKALKNKFIDKVLQMSKRDDIDRFIEFYHDACKVAYEKHKRKMMKEAKKFKNNLILTV